MSGPINPSNSLLNAQAASYHRGHETNSKESSEKKEQERRLNLQLQQVRNQQQLKKTKNTGKGILA